MLSSVRQKLTRLTHDKLAGPVASSLCHLVYAFHVSISTARQSAGRMLIALPLDISVERACTCVPRVRKGLQFASARTQFVRGTITFTARNVFIRANWRTAPINLRLVSSRVDGHRHPAVSKVRGRASQRSVHRQSAISSSNRRRLVCYYHPIWLYYVILSADTKYSMHDAVCDWNAIGIMFGVCAQVSTAGDTN